MRIHALQRLRNGHFHLETLESVKVKVRVRREKTTKELTIVRYEVLASQRMQSYCTCIVVNSDGHYIKSPYSRCTCAAGEMFCAHMLGLLCFCELSKMNPAWDRSTFEKRMLSNTDILQRQVIPIAAMHAQEMNSRHKADE